ncbi:MAG: hypothetical protein ACREO2_06165, partial [Arenimonas sp.]
MNSTQTPPSANSNAMQAFRRGIDRRAYVLARAQCGDDDLLQSALIGVDTAFNAEYAELPISQWPIRFWTLLLSRKELAQGHSPWPALASISHGPRAALLLRLVAGLDFSHAAQVLNISETTYRFALERGLEQLHAAGFNFAELERLRDSFFDEVKQLPTELIKTRERPAVVVPVAVPVVEAEPEIRKSARWPWILSLVLLVLSALGAWWWWNNQPEDVATAKPIALTEIQNAVIHPDYDVIANPEIQKQVEDLAFLSWIAAGAPEENFEVLKSGEISKPPA